MSSVDVAMFQMFGALLVASVCAVPLVARFLDWWTE